MWPKIRQKLFYLFLIIVFMELGSILTMLYQVLPFERRETAQLTHQLLDEKSSQILELQKEIQILRVDNNRLLDEAMKFAAERSKLISLEELSKLTRPLSQGVNRAQLRSIISNILGYLGEKNSKWIDLLMLTAQVESDLGTLFKQVKGPAVGIFQMEPATEKDIWENFLKYNKNLSEKIKKLRVPAKLGSHEMEYNISYATAMTYALYRQRKVDPTQMDLDQMERAYKLKYNTIKGKATRQNSVAKLYGSCLLEN